MPAYQFGLYQFILLGGAAIALGLAVICWQRRSVPGATQLLLLELTIAVWALGATFEAAAEETSVAVAWGLFGYLGITFSALAFFLFASKLSRQDKWITPRAVALLAVIPTITLLMALTNGWHHLHWSAVWTDPQTGLHIYERGPWFWVFVTWSYTLVFSSIAILIRAWFNSPKFHRPQLTTLIVGSCLPALGSLIYVSDLNPIPRLDWTPLAFVLSGIVLAWGLLRHQLLDLMPIARSQLVESMADGILVLDMKGRIVDVNPAARHFFDRNAAEMVGKPLAAALPHHEEFTAKVQAESGTRSEVYLACEDQQRYVELEITLLHDTNGRMIGRLIVLRDITNRRQLESEREKLIADLESALAEVKTLSGLMPICSSCKKIRDDTGYWHGVESYISRHSDAEFTHSLCPDCVRKLYPNFTG